MTCPTCVTSAPWLRNPHRPFCSLAGRLLDLGVWFDQGCRVPFDERGDVP
ncbi:MAG: DNA gyrase inhibitor YacG [Candidatus Rokuibacteriota bacterium]|nr:MAG: DNA gyrase inhibitor YacG [Candidatus Rokubacteria bacterium]